MPPFGPSSSLRIPFPPPSLVCVSMCVWSSKKILKVGRKKKKRKEKRKKESEKEDKLNCLDRVRALASSPAVSFACLKLHHAAKETKYKICSISQLYYIRITRPTVRKRNTSHAVLNANNGKKVKLIVQMSFAEKSKAEGSLNFQTIFSLMADFRDVVSVLSSSPTFK